MAETKFKFKKCELLPNEGSSLDEKYELLGGGPIIDYYESIDSPTVSMNITFIDIDQVISRKGISGGENIDITIQIDGFDESIEKTKTIIEPYLLNLKIIVN